MPLPLLAMTILLDFVPQMRPRAPAAAAQIPVLAEEPVEEAVDPSLSNIKKLEGSLKLFLPIIPTPITS